MQLHDLVYDLLVFRYSSGTATFSSTFGIVSQDFIFDGVRCNGTEQSLLECPGYCDHDCDGTEGAGVICQGR